MLTCVLFVWGVVDSLATPVISQSTGLTPQEVLWVRRSRARVQFRECTD